MYCSNGSMSIQHRFNEESKVLKFLDSYICSTNLVKALLLTDQKK